MSFGVIARLFAATLTIMISGIPGHGQAVKSPVEALLNPFGDPWSLARPNPDARLMGTFSCHRVLPQKFWTISREQKQFVTGLGTRLYVSECTNLLAHPDDLSDTLHAKLIKRRIGEFKQERSDAKYIGYYSISTYSAGAPAFQELRDAHQSWFVRKYSSDPQSAYIQTRKGGLILDVTNPEFQTFIAKQAKRSLEAYGMDGFLADGVYDSIERLTASPDVPLSIRTRWASGWIELLAKLQHVVGKDRMVMPNMTAGNPDFVKAVLPFVSGVFLEDPLGPLSLNLAKSGALERYLDLVATAAKLDKYIVNFVNTNINGTNAQTTNSQQERRFARYYFAAHLVFTTSAKALMAYYTPSELGPQFRSDAFFRDWNSHVGHPVAAFSTPDSDIYRRQYDKADVYLNNSNRTYRIALDGPRFTPEGDQVTAYEMPPKSGIFLFAERPK
jgi:hypothetical protein